MNNDNKKTNNKDKVKFTDDQLGENKTGYFDKSTKENSNSGRGSKNEDNQ